MRYVLDFGSGNSGHLPLFEFFRNVDTGASLTHPAITDRGNGEYTFEWAWADTTATTISYRAFLDGATLSGPDLHGVETSNSVTAAASVAGTAAGVNPWLWTAAQIINMAAVEVGLSEVADPYASTDPSFVQLRTLLKSAGHELMQARDWMVLVRECTITGDGVTTTFSPPADFLRMKDQSGWNRTDQRAFALTSSQQWQALTAWTTTSTLTTRYRWQQGRFVLYEAPAVGTLAFEYVSRYWVASSGAAAADLYAPAIGGDVVMFEPLMATRLLKAKFLQAKGLDSVGAFAEYQQAYEAAAGLEPAPVLNLGGCSGGERFIDTDNLPDTGYGL
jgi:hypothetical protein